MSDDYIPCKNDIVINPLSNRGVVVGSQTWRKLVKQGVLKGHYKPNTTTREIDDDDLMYAKKAKSKVPPTRKPKQSTEDNVLTTDDFDGMSTDEIKMRLKKLMKVHKAVYPVKKEPKATTTKSKFKLKEPVEEVKEDTEISEDDEMYFSDSE